MGVNQTHYVILGIRVPFLEREDLEDFHDNEYKSEVTSQGLFTLVADGMDGEYIVMGKVLAKGLEHEGISFTTYEYDEDESKEIGEQVCSILGIKFQAATLHAFTHWH